jgi:hypothetical protein
MGCWMEISDTEGEKIRVKVKDGEIIFPKDGAGRTATVEGEVYKIEFDEDEAKDFLNTWLKNQTRNLILPLLRVLLQFTR